MVDLSNIKVAFGERVTLRDGDFLLRQIDRVGLIGSNGAGESTLLKIITGQAAGGGACTRCA